MSDTKLKPCPFCGCKNISIESNGIGDFYIICGDGEEGCSSRTSDYRCESKKQAIERWNIRHDERENNQPRADLKQCAKALKRNHVWHNEYDEYQGYDESDLCEQNMKVLSIPNVQSALKDQTK